MALARYQVMMTYRNGDDTTKGHRLLDEAAAIAPQDDDHLQAELAFFRGLCHRTDADEATAAQWFGKALQMDGSLMPARLAMMASPNGGPFGGPAAGGPARP